MSKKEILAVRVYQAVKFNKSLDTFFSTERIKNLEPKKLTVNKEIGGIEIEDSRDHIVVPFTNVSVIYLKSKAAVEKIEEKKKQAEKVKKTNESKRDTTPRPK